MSDSSDDEAPLKRRGSRRKLESDSDAEPEVEPQKKTSMRPKRNAAKKVFDALEKIEAFFF